MSDSDQLDSALRVMRLIAVAMTLGVTALAAVVMTKVSTAPEPMINGYSFIKLFSMINLGLSAALWSLSATMPLVMARAGSQVAPLVRVQSSFIVALALREGSALLGLVACLVGAPAVKAQPLYWLNAFPAALFVALTLTRLPDREWLQERLESLGASQPI